MAKKRSLLRLVAAAGVLATTLVATPGWAQPAQPTQPPAQPALPVVPIAPATQPLPAHQWTPQQIVQAFELADADRNGELSRGEAARLAIVPRGFEDMDQNKDGNITRAEYEAAFVR